ADDDVEFAVGAEAYDAAVVIAAMRGLVGLEGMQPDERLLKRERRAVPQITVNAIAQERHVVHVRGVRAGAALSPIEIDARVRGKLRTQGDAEQAALGV